MVGLRRGPSSSASLNSSAVTRAGAKYAPVAALIAVLAAGCGSAAASPAGNGVPSSLSSSSSSSSPSGPHVVVVRDDANGKTVDVPAGAMVELILGSTYWKVSGSSAPTVLRQDGGSTMLPRPTNCPDIPGSSCAPLRTDFTALAPGSSTVTASRTSCGEAMRCGPNQSHFAVTVVVQQQ